MKRLSVSMASLVLAILMGACAHTGIGPNYEAPLAGPETALDRYVHAEDPAYRWSIANTIDNGGGTKTYVIDMTSQTWLSPEEVNRTEWKHWLLVTVPAQVQHDTALLFIGGGKNGGDPPKESMPEVLQSALATNSVAALLLQVPNQPLSFDGEEEGRSEDDLIAYTWNKFMTTGDERWPARLPMTKSAVRAMDTVTALTADTAISPKRVEKFVVSGGSKRGWTTWTTAAVDHRVVAIIPFVIDLLNVVPSFMHHYEVYGFFAPAVDDYVNQGIMDWMGTNEYEELLRLVEPYSYRKRLTMPKLIVNASGDQFFLPDSSQFYWDGLEGPKYLRYVPNADHGLDDTDAGETLLAFYASILTGAPLPEYDWTFPDDNTISVTTTTPVLEARSWHATNPTARDFRVETIGKAWKSQVFASNKGTTYDSFIGDPTTGWTAFFVELTFQGPGGLPLKLTTPVRVVPDVVSHQYLVPAQTPRGYLSK